MNQREIKEYLIDFQKRDLPRIVARQMKTGESRKIISVIGPRRAGKTYFLFQKMKELMDNGLSRENILYLNFEDPRLIGISFKDIREIIKLQWQLFQASLKGTMYVFMDEPQNVKSWEAAVRSLHDEEFKVYLTGSSSKLLSKEIATSLRGRTLSYLLLPFSFAEFLNMRGIAHNSNQSSKENAIIMNNLDEFLEFGGFPEVVLENDRMNKLKIISEYFDLIIYRDIVERYGIRNTQIVRWLIKILTSSFSKEFSGHKVYLTLKSQGAKLSKNTLYAYLSILQDSFFVFMVPKFSFSVRKQEMFLSKAYLSDTGFIKLIELSEERGRKIENAVFLELKRRQTPLSEIFYWKGQNEEVDFVIKEGPGIKQLIQVCLSVENKDTKDREIKALIKGSDELKCNSLLVITENYEAKETHSGKKIIFIPLWKWLLS